MLRKEQENDGQEIYDSGCRNWICGTFSCRIERFGADVFIVIPSLLEMPARNGIFEEISGL